MIVTETFKTLANGTILIKTYSNKGMYIIQNGTGTKYPEAIDPINMNRTYTESSEKIEDELKTL